MFNGFLKLQDRLLRFVSILLKRLSLTIMFPSWMWVAFIILAIAKLWLIGGQTLFAIGGAGHDDRLFVNLAIALLKGEWLGTYNNLTLAKGMFYPLWIATTYLLGVPLMLAQHLLYITACVTFVIALRPLLPRPAMLLLIYTILLFNPVSYTDGPMTRVIREGIYPALTILVCAGAVGLLTWQDRSIKSLGFWSTYLGFALSAFWLTREEGVWVIPSIALVIGLAATRLCRTRPIDWIRRLALCVFPFVIWMIAVATVAGINNAHYGIFTTVEFKSQDFLAAYGAISRVNHAQWQPYILVPKEARMRMYSISPAFAELKPFLEGNIGKGWSKISQSDEIRGGQSDEIKGGWFMWALRDAVASAGYCNSAGSAAEYYRRLANEINVSCTEGKIDCGTERASMMPPWRDEYAQPLLKAIVRSGVYLVRFEGFTANSGTSVGSDDSLTLFRIITGGRLSTNKNQLNLRGWTFSPDSAINISVRTKNGDLADATLKLVPSPDVYNHFLAGGRDIPSAREARFEITVSDISECYLYVRSGDRLLGSLPLDGSQKSLQTSELYFYLDSLDYQRESNLSKLDNLRVNFLGKIGIIYQKVMPILTSLALIAYTIFTVQVFRKRINVVVWVINTALLIAIVARILIISLIDVSSFSAINTMYLSPAHPLLLIFISFVLTWCLEPFLNTLDVKINE